MYDRGRALVQMSWRFPDRPMIGNRGQKETSKPVAQMIASTSMISPASVTRPFDVMRAMESETTLTFDCNKASRYPTPGVILRQLSGKEGIRALINVSSFPRAARMYWVTASVVALWVSESFNT